MWDKNQTRTWGENENHVHFISGLTMLLLISEVPQLLPLTRDNNAQIHLAKVNQIHQVRHDFPISHVIGVSGA